MRVHCRTHSTSSKATPASWALPAAAMPSCSHQREPHFSHGAALPVPGPVQWRPCDGLRSHCRRAALPGKPGGAEHCLHRCNALPAHVAGCGLRTWVVVHAWPLALPLLSSPANLTRLPPPAPILPPPAPTLPPSCPRLPCPDCRWRTASGSPAPAARRLLALKSATRWTARSVYFLPPIWGSSSQTAPGCRRGSKCARQDKGRRCCSIGRGRGCFSSTRPLWLLLLRPLPAQLLPVLQLPHATLVD